jgi:hypothetical protein
VANTQLGGLTHRSSRMATNNIGIRRIRTADRLLIKKQGSDPTISRQPSPLSNVSKTNNDTIIRCVGNYDIGKTLGKGRFGKVKIATHVLTGEIVSTKRFAILHQPPNKDHFPF